MLSNEMEDRILELKYDETEKQKIENYFKAKEEHIQLENVSPPYLVSIFTTIYNNSKFSNRVKEQLNTKLRLINLYKDLMMKFLN